MKKLALFIFTLLYSYTFTLSSPPLTPAQCTYGQCLETTVVDRGVDCVYDLYNTGADRCYTQWERLGSKGELMCNASCSTGQYASVECVDNGGAPPCNKTTKLLTGNCCPAPPADPTPTPTPGGPNNTPVPTVPPGGGGVGTGPIKISWSAPICGKPMTIGGSVNLVSR
ncbi:MAG: hypothetical protein G01um101416_881, partial [Microgenomates group bacterium Gr01-1014_16]